MIYGDEEDDSPSWEYTVEDLNRDLDSLRKSGLIEVSGINEDGEWIYSMTDFGRKIYDEINDSDPAKVAKLLEEIIEKTENEEH